MNAANKSAKVIVWITDEGKLITNPAALGFKEEDCGPDMLCGANSTYCERIAKYRVSFGACDGSFKKLADTLEGAKTWVQAYGCNNDTRVSNDGINRFEGFEYKTANSKHWWPLHSTQIVDSI